MKAIRTFGQLRGASAAVVVGCGIAAWMVGCGDSGPSSPEPPDPTLVAQGKDIFRFDTFGDETFWTDTLRMHEVIQRARSIRRRRSRWASRSTPRRFPPRWCRVSRTARSASPTRRPRWRCSSSNAVVGLKGTVETVERAGHAHPRRHHLRALPFDGGQFVRARNRQAARRLAQSRSQPGRDHRALARARPPTQKAVYNSWGPGKYDPRFNFDGLNGPAVIPPAYGLLGVNSITYTGDGTDIAYWNRYVGVTQMHGHGTLHRAAHRASTSTTRRDHDLVASCRRCRRTSSSLAAPAPPAGSFDAAAADARPSGVRRRRDAARPATRGHCFTDANIRLHAPAEVVSEPEPNGAPSYASRSATKQYRTTPLRGLLAARAVLPRRKRGDAGRRGRALRCQEGPRAHHAAEGRSGGVSEVALTRTPSAALAPGSLDPAGSALTRPIHGALTPPHDILFSR